MLLTEENKKLTSELDKVSDSFSFTLIEHMLAVQPVVETGYNFVFGVHVLFNIVLSVQGLLVGPGTFSLCQSVQESLERGFCLSYLILCPIYFFEPLFCTSLSSVLFLTLYLTFAT